MRLTWKLVIVTSSVALQTAPLNCGHWRQVRYCTAPLKSVCKNPSMNKLHTMPSWMQTCLSIVFLFLFYITQELLVQWVLKRWFSCGQTRDASKESAVVIKFASQLTFVALGTVLVINGTHRNRLASLCCFVCCQMLFQRHLLQQSCSLVSCGWHSADDKLLMKTVHMSAAAEAEVSSSHPQYSPFLYAKCVIMYTCTFGKTDALVCIFDLPQYGATLTNQTNQAQV